MGVQENKAAVAAAYEAFGKGDVAAVVGMNAPDAVWANYAVPQSPFGGEHKGLDAIGAYFSLIADNVEITQFDIAPIAAEGDVVVATGYIAYTVKKTGKTISGPLCHIFTFGPDGKVTKFEEWEPQDPDAWS